MMVRDDKERACYGLLNVVVESEDGRDHDAKCEFERVMLVLEEMKFLLYQ